MFSLEEIAEKICEHTSLSRSKVLGLIEEKEDELSGLVSKEGAAYIVAREFGISLLRESKRQAKIKNLSEGMNSVEIVARIVNISETRNFDKDGSKGSVVNFVLGDETGMVRLSLWNDEIDMINDMGLKEGDAIRIARGYVKMDNRGNLEVRLGRGRMEKVEEEVKLPEAGGLASDYGMVRRKSLSEAKEGETIEARACLVQLFRKNPFFEVCPTCGLRMKNKAGKWVCDQHGDEKPAYNMVVSGVLDDGYGNIRIVFFRELAERLFGKTAAELRAYAQERVDPMAVYEIFEGLGKDYIIRGRLKKNELTENLEMVANSIEEPDIKKEFGMLMKEIS